MFVDGFFFFLYIHLGCWSVVVCHVRFNICLGWVLVLENDFGGGTYVFFLEQVCILSVKSRCFMVFANKILDNGFNFLSDYRRYLGYLIKFWHFVFFKELISFNSVCGVLCGIALQSF